MQLSKRLEKRFDVPNDSDGAYVDIRHLRMHEIRAIESAANKITMTSKGDESFTQIEVNPYARSKGIATECLIGWSGFNDDLGRPIPFSKQNISKMANFDIQLDNGDVVDFYSWVSTCHDEFDEEVRANEADAEKN